MMDRFCSDGVGLLQHPVDIHPAVLLDKCIKLSAVLPKLVTFGKINVIQYTLYIKSGPADYHRDTTALYDILDSFRRFFLKHGYVKIIGRVEDIYEVMRNPLHLLFCDLCRSYVHTAIDLH